VVDLLFANPIMTVRHVQQNLGISQPGAMNLLRALSDEGIVRQVGTGAGVRHRWFADGVLRVLDPDLAAQTAP
jgi:predicted HTH transcriptional regulator